MSRPLRETPGDRRSPFCAVVLALCGVVLALCAGGCTSTFEPPSGDPALDLRHNDPRIRVRATRDAVEKDRQDLVPHLIERLSDRDGSVRLFSAIALRKMTGERFGFLAYGSLEERRLAIERWNEWAGAVGLASGTAAASSSETSDDD